MSIARYVFWAALILALARFGWAAVAVVLLALALRFSFRVARKFAGRRLGFRPKSARAGR